MTCENLRLLDHSHFPVPYQSFLITQGLTPVLINDGRAVKMLPDVNPCDSHTPSPSPSPVKTLPAVAEGGRVEEMRGGGGGGGGGGGDEVLEQLHRKHAEIKDRADAVRAMLMQDGGDDDSKALMKQVLGLEEMASLLATAIKHRMQISRARGEDEGLKTLEGASSAVGSAVEHNDKARMQHPSHSSLSPAAKAAVVGDDRMSSTSPGTRRHNHHQATQRNQHTESSKLPEKEQMAYTSPGALMEISNTTPFAQSLPPPPPDYLAPPSDRSSLKPPSRIPSAPPPRHQSGRFQPKRRLQTWQVDVQKAINDPTGYLKRSLPPRPSGAAPKMLSSGSGYGAAGAEAGAGAGEKASPPAKQQESEHAHVSPNIDVTKASKQQMRGSSSRRIADDRGTRGDGSIYKEASPSPRVSQHTRRASPSLEGVGLPPAIAVAAVKRVQKEGRHTRDEDAIGDESISSLETRQERMIKGGDQSISSLGQERMIKGGRSKWDAGQRLRQHQHQHHQHQHQEGIADVTTGIQSKAPGLTTVEQVDVKFRVRGGDPGGDAVRRASRDQR